MILLIITTFFTIAFSSTIGKFDSELSSKEFIVLHSTTKRFIIALKRILNEASNKAISKRKKKQNREEREGEIKTREQCNKSLNR